MAQARYPWSNELHGSTDDGGTLHRRNIWQGTFPTENTGDDGFLTTAPVRSSNSPESAGGNCGFRTVAAGG